MQCGMQLGFLKWIPVDSHFVYIIPQVDSWGFLENHIRILGGFWWILVDSWRFFLDSGWILQVATCASVWIPVDSIAASLRDGAVARWRGGVVARSCALAVWHVEPHRHTNSAMPPVDSRPANGSPLPPSD